MKAFLVVGPEGSGTYLLWEALASAGCGIDIEERPELYTVRYSLPHAHEWPDLLDITGEIEERGYSIQPLIILRDYYCTIMSVLRRDKDISFPAVELNMSNALWKIGQLASNYPYTIYITYEAFCQNERFRRWLFCNRLGLSEPDIEIKYANEKYYE